MKFFGKFLLGTAAGIAAGVLVSKLLRRAQDPDAEVNGAELLQANEPPAAEKTDEALCAQDAAATQDADEPAAPAAEETEAAPQPDGDGQTQG